ncbi:MAG: TIGR00282 family metallophosphoesterase [Erysipelotrichaceae bacterium]|nr:TIGR00282 family metallophosphoesterase [Erysipelotrichaceae bacterium]
MNLLFIGDIVGRSGRNIVFNFLDQIKAEYDIDFVIANGENSAHGKGITKKIYQQLMDAGIDCITLGNHAFSKKEIVMDIDHLDNMIRPYNLNVYPEKGHFIKVYNICGLNLGIVNIMGKVFMNNVEKTSFDAMKDLLYRYRIKDKYKLDLLFVDLHAEATSEKILFANYFKNECIAVVGTHTHIQTADERLIGGCAYISDTGMCGPYNSIIGRDINEMIESMILGIKTHYTIAGGEAIFNAVVIEIDNNTRRATAIKRIQIRPQNEN